MLTFLRVWREEDHGSLQSGWRPTVPIPSSTEIVNRTRYWPPLPGQRHFPTQHYTLTSLSSCLSSVADLPPSSPTGLVNTSVNTCSNLMKEAAGLGCTHQKPRKDCKQPTSFVRDVYQSRKFARSLESCQWIFSFSSADKYHLTPYMHSFVPVHSAEHLRWEPGDKFVEAGLPPALTCPPIQGWRAGDRWRLPASGGEREAPLQLRTD